MVLVSVPARGTGLEPRGSDAAGLNAVLSERAERGVCTVT